MKLSIIIVNWNVRKDLLTCLRSIEENRPCEEFEIIIVDNASSDGTADAVSKCFPRVTVVANSRNRGFAAANNQGIKKSQGQYILLLNPDTIVHPGSLDKLIKFMDDNEDVGICGPKLLNDDGTIQQSVRNFPDFRSALYRNTIFRHFGFFRKNYQRYTMHDFNYDKQMDVEQVMGAALMIRSSIIDELYNFDERFFMYYEEVDLCYRIKKAGWRIVFIPGPEITHLGGGSTNQIPIQKRFMALASLFAFFRKHRGRFAATVFICVFKPAFILRDICNVAAGVVTYIFAALALRNKLRKKSAAKVKKSATSLVKYSWQLLFKM